MKINFKLHSYSDLSKPLEIDVKRIINAGYTGRDQKAIQAHIDELKEEGIPAPEKTPTYFPKLADRITQDVRFEVLDESDHSGEAEFALLLDKGKIYVGVGSDHTDRKLEAFDIKKAKQVYLNTISEALWDLDDVRNHWDQLILRSWVEIGGERTLFQEATLDMLLPPDDLIARVKGLLADPGDTEGLVVYSGTVASLIKADYSKSFEVELEDPKLNRKLSQRYTMRPVSAWFKG